MERELIVATCQFPVSADIKRNESYILKQIEEAKAKEAEIAHFSESSLSGYAGMDFRSFRCQDETVLRGSLEKIIQFAAKFKIWVIAGNHQFDKNQKNHTIVCG